MSKTARIMFLSGVLFVGLASLCPIWRIEIWAPQYPEGLSLQIKTDGMSGNIDQINILNHYIGMRKIIPDEIPELQIIPRVLWGILITGVIVAALGSLIFARAWLLTFVATLLAGLYDFYRWGYEYGHNLNPDAPLKIPGYSYQPPLIGHKQILNIDSYSLPDVGGYILLGALALLFLAVAWDTLSQVRRSQGKNWLNSGSKNNGAIGRTVAAAVASLFLIGCTAKPEPLKVGVDHCDACRMTITDDRFGGEIITDKGRIYKFDSLDCLLGYYRSHKEQTAKVLVSDFAKPGQLVEVSQAQFLRSERVKGPMGSSVIASSDASAFKSFSPKPGAILTWANVSSR